MDKPFKGLTVAELIYGCMHVRKMTSNFTTPFRPRAKSRAVKLSRDLLPLDPTNTSIGISEREIKTEDDEVVCKEITYRRISEDNSVLTSLMTARTDPTNATIDSPNGRAIQIMHVVGELLTRSLISV